MLAIPISSNSIQIPLIETGCCTREFDSTYPKALAGIIRPSEFEESIANINKKISSAPRIICTLLMFVCLLGGFIMFIVGATQASHRKVLAFILVGVGLGLFFFGACSILWGFCILKKTLGYRLQSVVAKESKKYSNRLPVSCNWRLESKTVVRGRGRAAGMDVTLHIIIDINPPNY